MEEPAHAHNGRFIGESCQNLRLADKLLPAFFEECFLLAGQRNNGGMRPPVAGNASFGIVFLDATLRFRLRSNPIYVIRTPPAPARSLSDTSHEDAPHSSWLGAFSAARVIKPADRTNPLGLFQLRHAVHADHTWINHTFSLFHSAVSPAVLPVHHSLIPVTLHCPVLLLPVATSVPSDFSPTVCRLPAAMATISVQLDTLHSP